MWVATAAVVLVLALLFRLWQVWPRSRRTLGQQPRRTGAVRTMVVLGSGGHTSELLPVAAALDRKRYTPRLYVAAHSDALSLSRAQTQDTDAQTCTLYRARAVGQSYPSSVMTTLWALAQSVWLVVRWRPALVLCNGPAICVPLACGALVLRVLGGAAACRVVFIESGCRVSTQSLSGKLMRYLCDCYFVQWEEATKLVPEAQFVGRTL